MDLPCRSLKEYFQETFGETVYKLPVDAGMSCPNRDGTQGTGGCSFCNPVSFRPDDLSGTERLERQLEKGRRRYRDRGATRYLAYLQTGTNTHAPPDRLEHLFERLLRPSDVVGLCVGTRPDCLSADVVRLLGRVAADHEVWVEIGQQTSRNETLRRTNRCHTWEDYRRAVERLRRYPALRLCVHVMFGLPGEGTPDMVRTVEDLMDVGLDGIKFHQTQVVRHTALEEAYRAGRYEPIRYERYRDLVVWALNVLPDSTVVHRLLSQTSDRWLVAPRWEVEKFEFIRAVERASGSEPEEPVR